MSDAREIVGAVIFGVLIMVTVSTPLFLKSRGVLKPIPKVDAPFPPQPRGGRKKYTRRV